MNQVFTQCTDSFMMVKFHLLIIDMFCTKLKIIANRDRPNSLNQKIYFGLSNYWLQNKIFFTLKAKIV